MKDLKAGQVFIDNLEGGLLMTVSTNELCFSMLLELEEARELSAELFQKYVDRMLGERYNDRN